MIYETADSIVKPWNLCFWELGFTTYHVDNDGRRTSLKDSGCNILNCVQWRENVTSRESVDEEIKENAWAQTPWPESASELYRRRDSRLSATLVPTSAVRGGGGHVVCVTDPYGSILGFLDRSRYFFFQVAPQLYSRVWVDPVPDPLLLRKSDSAGNRTRTSASVARNSDHTTEATNLCKRLCCWKNIVFGLHNRPQHYNKV
jgi:hypothetical protein